MSSNPFDSREGVLDEIRCAGRYLIDHAENILGEYPALMGELTLTIRIRQIGVTTLVVNREHVVVDAEKYAINIEKFNDRHDKLTAATE